MSIKILISCYDNFQNEIWNKKYERNKVDWVTLTANFHQKLSTFVDYRNECNHYDLLDDLHSYVEIVEKYFSIEALVERALQNGCCKVFGTVEGYYSWPASWFALKTLATYVILRKTRLFF